MWRRISEGISRKSHMKNRKSLHYILSKIIKTFVLHKTTLNKHHVNIGLAKLDTTENVNNVDYSLRDILSSLNTMFKYGLQDRNKNWTS
jgi:hypothetical protein